MPSPFDAMYQDPVAAPPNPKGPRWEDPDVAARGFGDLSGDEQMAEIERANALSNAVTAYEDEQNAAALAGVRTPSQFDTASVAGMRGGEQAQRGDNWLELLSSTVQMPSAPNPIRPIREQYADTMLGDGSMVTDLDAQGNVVQRSSGLVPQEEFQTGMLHAAQVDEQRAHAAAYGQEASRQQARIDVMEQKAVRDAQRQQDAIAKSQLVMSKVSEAADRLNESPDIDPNRYWASQSAGRKAGWAISAGLLGFAGLNPFGALQQAISNDIDAQKATFAQKQAGFAARQGELDSSRSVYQDIRTAIGDEQATDLMMEQARLAQAETAFKAMAVKEGIPPAIAANNLFLTQLQQRNAEITKTLGEMLATTPERIGGGSRPLLSPLMQKVALGELKDARSTGSEMEKLAITEGGKAASDQLKHEADMAKVEAEGGKKDRVNYENRRMIAKETAVPNRIRTLAADILADIAQNDGDVPGVGSVYIPGLGAPKHQLTRAARDIRRKLDMLGEYDITNLTGAVSSPEQQKVIRAFLDGDESAITSGLVEIQRAMDTLVNTIEGADPESAADIRAHTKKGAAGWRGARVDRPVGSSSVVEEDE